MPTQLSQIEATCETFEEQFDNVAAMYQSEPRPIVFVYYPVDENPDQYVDALTEASPDNITLEPDTDESDDGLLVLTVDDRPQVEVVCETFEEQFDNVAAMYQTEPRPIVFVYYPVDEDPEQYVDALTEASPDGVTLEHDANESDDDVLVLTVGD